MAEDIATPTPPTNDVPTSVTVGNDSKKSRVMLLIGTALCALLTIFVMAGALFGTSDEYSWFTAQDIMLFVGAPLGLLTILLGWFIIRKRKGLA